MDLAGRIIFDENDVEVFNFGKYKGKSVVDVLRKDQGYYSWILSRGFCRQHETGPNENSTQRNEQIIRNAQKEKR